MNRRITWVCLLAAMLSLVAPVWAEHTRFWRQSDFSDFQKGTPDGVALRSDGKLTPAPRFAPYADSNMAYLYMLRIDSKGRLYGVRLDGLWVHVGRPESIAQAERAIDRSTL